jgi:hypothetical protein
LVAHRRARHPVVVVNGDDHARSPSESTDYSSSEPEHESRRGSRRTKVPFRRCCIDAGRHRSRRSAGRACAGTCSRPARSPPTQLAHASDGRARVIQMDGPCVGWRNEKGRRTMTRGSMRISPGMVSVLLIVGPPFCWRLRVADSGEKAPLAVSVRCRCAGSSCFRRSQRAAPLGYSVETMVRTLRRQDHCPEAGSLHRLRTRVIRPCARRSAATLAHRPRPFSRGRGASGRHLLHDLGEDRAWAVGARLGDGSGHRAGTRSHDGRARRRDRRRRELRNQVDRTRPREVCL